MTPLNGVVLAVWAIVLAALFPTYVRIWRHREALDRLERTWRLMWPYSEAALQGWLRAQTAAYIAGWFALLAPAGILIRDAPPSMRVPIACVALVGVVGVLTMVVICASIILFNRPKRLVVPALRDQAGLVAERRNSRPRK